MTVDGKQLNQWADALGVDNDADAIAAMHKLVDRAEALTEEIRRLWRTFPIEVSSGSWADVLSTAASRAVTSMELTEDGLTTILTYFKRHERGA
jgi:hypothetical protein